VAPEVAGSNPVTHPKRHHRLTLAAAWLVWVAALVPAFASQEPPDILVSRQLLTAARLRVGDLVQLSVASDGAGARTFRIAGVYEPIANPALLGAKRLEVRMHLPDLTSLAGSPADPMASETVTSINVLLKDPQDAAAFGAELSARIPGLVARGASGNTGPFVVLRQFHLAIALVTVIASSIFLLALMVMLVDERREVVGMLRLIGFTRRRILVQVLAEGVLIALFGAAFGVAFAAGAERAINVFFQWKYDTTLVFVHITPRVAMQSVVLAVPLGVAASTLASWTLLRKQAYALARR
jgi:ABC-type lipoprotein release transport system permease subunit